MNVDSTKFARTGLYFETDNERNCMAKARDGFVRREDFINHTGVFVNGVGYDIAARRYRASGKNTNEFLMTYTDIYKDSIAQTKSGIKYEGLDFLKKKEEVLNDMEVMYLLSVEGQCWEDRALVMEEIGREKDI